MITIAYLRISTDKQDQASQRHIITEHMAATGGTVDEWLADTASGGTPWQQRQIAETLTRLAPGDCLIVSEISRIARSTIGVLTFLQEAAEREISVMAIKSGIKLDGSLSSKIVVTVLAMAAEIERDLLRERTRASLQARKATGLPIGRQPGARGKRNKLAGKEKEIADLLEKKISKAGISRLLAVSRQTLDTFLHLQDELAKIKATAANNAADFMKESES